MSIGKKADRVTVIRKTRTKRADGGYDTVSKQIGTYWVSVTPVRALESEEAGRQHGQTTYLIEMDSRLDVRTDDFLNWQGAEMNIREVRRPPRSTMNMTIVADYGVIV